ncbi:uncharacterized protein LOC135468306 [Liolophura sinensis]|uniref:uncharacterized protein LOC135468306 n=1 Tax=Liolophura sinensis TaxID=3198878 RepID=UPI0031591CCD
MAFPPGERCAVVHCAGSNTVSCVIDGVSQVVQEPRVTERCHRCTCLDQYSYRCDRGCYTDIAGIQPSSACPSPQLVHIEGECCPQIWCNPASNFTESTPNTVKLLKVSWATAQNLNLEFSSPVTGDLNGSLLGYHIFYWESDAVPPTSIDEWAHRFLPLNQTQEQSSSNSSNEAFEESFASGSTVRTALNGLNPGQTYLVRIQIGLLQDNSHGLSSLNSPKESDAPLSVIAVAPPITGYKCWVKDRYISHGKQYQDGCDVVCTCSFGELSCEPVCPVDPPTCPRPVERSTAGECCGRTKCYGKPGCCPYGNTTLEDGDTVRESCERYCRCDNGTVSCWQACSHLKPPRPECTKVYHKDRCCPTWRCPSEKHPPFGIEARVTLKVTGVCDGQNKQFLQEMSRSITDLFRSEDLCAAKSENNSLVTCSDSQFTTICPEDQHGGASSGTILIIVTVKVFNEALDPDFTGGPQLRETVDRIRNLTSSGIEVTIGDVTYPVMTMIYVSDSTVICRPGYLKHDHGCMAGHVISSNRSVSYHVAMNVLNVTESTASLRWTGLPHDHLQYLDALRLEYRDIVANGTWLTTEKLHVSRTGYVLRALAPTRFYLVRLLLLTSSPGLGRYTAASSVFKTLYIKAISRPEITGMDVSSSAVTVRWSELPDEHRRYAEEYFIAFSNISKGGQAFPYNRTPSLAPTVTEYTLQALAPDTIYKVKVALVLSNGTTVFSLSADVRTKEAEVSGFISHRAVIIGVSSVAFLAVAALITLLVCIFKMRRSSSRLSVSSSENNFENKMFDMETTPEKASWDKTTN